MTLNAHTFFNILALWFIFLQFLLPKNICYYLSDLTDSLRTPSDIFPKSLRTCNRVKGSWYLIMLIRVTYLAALDFDAYSIYGVWTEMSM